MTSQVLLTPTIITKESLVMLENNLVAANRVNRSFENRFSKIGSTLTVRKPNRFTVASGAALAMQSIAEPSVTITVDQQKHVDFQFTSQDLTLTVEEFSARYLKPAMAALANKIDFDVLQKTLGISNYVGTPAVIPSAFSSSVQLVGQRMDDNAAPQEDRTMIMNPAGYWAMSGGLVNSFVMPTAKEALVKGYLSTIGGYDVYMDQNTANLVGTVHSTSNIQVSSNGQIGSSLSTACGGLCSDIFNIGEVFTINGVNNINPQTRLSTGTLKNFTITASSQATLGAVTTATLVFTPPIVTSGPYQNVDFGPSTAAVISWLTGTSAAQINRAQNIAFMRDAIGLVMVPLEMPNGLDFGARNTYKNISMRVVRDYDINNDVFPTRIDVLYGTTVFYDELAVRLGG